ncbi:hypothetical protein SAMCCGM7_Ch2596 [Sinorhizobium americanum CCGM7]|nr:hypothetical protein SAMCCGM7_Ch2596 [Sinorhizobium americanum CCGM7]
MHSQWDILGTFRARAPQCARCLNASLPNGPQAFAAPLEAARPTALSARFLDVLIRSRCRLDSSIPDWLYVDP